MSVEVHIDDPCDVVRYLIDSNWNLNDYSPKPIIRNMVSYRTNRVNRDLIRPYLVSSQYEQMSIDAKFEQVTHTIRVDIQTTMEPSEKRIMYTCRNALLQQRKNPNPATGKIVGSTTYQQLFIDGFEDLTTPNLSHWVLTIRLQEQFVYAG